MAEDASNHSRAVIMINMFAMSFDFSTTRVARSSQHVEHFHARQAVSRKPAGNVVALTAFWMNAFGVLVERCNREYLIAVAALFHAIDNSSTRLKGLRIFAGFHVVFVCSAVRRTVARIDTPVN